MEGTLCKIQYVGKAETPFNIRLNNHRKDANGYLHQHFKHFIHFKQPGRNFSKHVKLTLIEKISNTINTDTDTIKIRLKTQLTFTCLKLTIETLEKNVEYVQS